MTAGKPTIDVRPVLADEHRVYLSVALRQFHADKAYDTEDDWAWRSRRWAGQRLTAAWDGALMVGTFRSWDRPLVVPGATLPTDYISSVTVSPTHRRRGILNSLMVPDLQRARQSGTPLAFLLSSDARIYGRYGFGCATEHATWTVDADPALFRLSIEAAGLSVELTDDAGLQSIAPDIYATAFLNTPGAIPREASFWDAFLGLAGLSDDKPDVVRNAVVVRDGDTPVAYARYQVKETSYQRVDTSENRVSDLVATTDAGYARIYQFLASIDLTKTLSIPDRPVSEALPWLLTDRRAARQSERADFGWVRLLDVAAALSGRRYLTPGRCVIQVLDRAGLADGIFALEVDDAGHGHAAVSTELPELTLEVAALGSAYLGQIPLAELTGAGCVVEHAVGSAGRLGALLWYPTTRAVTYTEF